MARMRQAKTFIKDKLTCTDWRKHLGVIAQGGATHIGPLFSMLLLEPVIMHRAAVALGATCAVLSAHDNEKARNVVRRYMWHLSEESGNIGWGIPEAFAETLIQSQRLANEFYKILITYIIDLGYEDNYCDNDILRRSCYFACARFAAKNPTLCLNWRGWFAKGLDDNDIICRGMACLGLGVLPKDLMLVPKLRSLVDQQIADKCVLFNGETIYEQSVSELAQFALNDSMQNHIVTMDY